MPLEVIESNDPITEVIQFRTSAIYEMMYSLETLRLQSGRHTAWATKTRQQLSSEFLAELENIYGGFSKAFILFELAIDYSDLNDIPGFLYYLRNMQPATFIHYLLGRVIPAEQFAETDLRLSSLVDVIETHTPDYQYYIQEKNMVLILDNIPAFQESLAGLWEHYWETLFADEISRLHNHWQDSIAEKQQYLAQRDGMSLYQAVTGKSKLPDQIPHGHPLNEIVFIPLYYISTQANIFYGYGNVTILFDSERTAARADEIKRNRQEVLEVAKALSDGTRLEILRLIAHSEGNIHGKKIAAKLEISTSAVSRHLNQLRDGGLITEIHDNRVINYALVRETLTQLPDKLLDYLFY
jgi:DNA-binding transcriptional ArsR family regulator